MKVLIAGGAGFIGSTVASACLDAGIQPVILDDLSTGRAEFVAGRPFYCGDIANGALVDRAFAEHPDIEAVIHAAAAIVVPESVHQPVHYYRENVSKSVEFLSHVIRNGCQRYLFSSSAAVYGATSGVVDELTPLAPASPYARTKMMMELVLEDVTAATQLRALSLRYFNPIGADPAMRSGLQLARPTHLLGRLLTAADEGTEFLLTGIDWPTRDGTGIRDFIHVWDLAAAHVKALQRFDLVVPGATRHNVINLGHGSGTTVGQFVTIFRAVSGRNVVVREVGRRPGDVPGSYTRIDRARHLLGWRPQLTIADAIRDYVRWSALRPTSAPSCCA